MIEKNLMSRKELDEEPLLFRGYQILGPNGGRRGFSDSQPELRRLQGDIPLEDAMNSGIITDENYPNRFRDTYSCMNHLYH